MTNDLKLFKDSKDCVIQLFLYVIFTLLFSFAMSTSPYKSWLEANIDRGTLEFAFVELREIDTAH